MRSMANRVTLVIPAYNAASHIRRALESVLAQTRRPDHILVVDDASVDETVDIVRGFTDQGVQLIKRSRNGGPGAARQSGFDRVNTPLVAFLDQDDEWRPHALELLVRVMVENQGVKLAYGGVQFFNEGLPGECYLPPEEIDFHALLAHILIPTQAMLFDTDTLRKAGGPRGPIRLTEDWDVCLRISHWGRCVGSPEVLANAHHHEKNASSDDRVMTRASLETLHLHRRAHTRCRQCRQAVRSTRRFYARRAILSTLEETHGLSRLRDLIELGFRHPDCVLSGMESRFRRAFS